MNASVSPHSIEKEFDGNFFPYFEKEDYCFHKDISPFAIPGEEDPTMNFNLFSMI